MLRLYDLVSTWMIEHLFVAVFVAAIDQHPEEQNPNCFGSLSSFTYPRKVCVLLAFQALKHTENRFSMPKGRRGGATAAVKNSLGRSLVNSKKRTRNQRRKDAAAQE